MATIIKKVIRASAGTGKTYRLSLEYIGLLLAYRNAGVHFSKILVITFTKKATAEIRENIFAHLQHIIQETDPGRELRANLKLLLNINVQDSDLTYLRHVHDEMVTNKNLVRISTIDSFTNTIFKTMISPYLGLTSYDIDNTADESILAEIYSRLIKDAAQWNQLKPFFSRSKRRTIQDYQQLMQSLLENRWVIHLMQETNTMANKGNQHAAADWAAFQSSYFKLVDDFSGYVREKHATRPITELLKNKWYKLLQDAGSTHPDVDIARLLKSPFKEPQFAEENHSQLFPIEAFWHGGKLFRKKEEATLKQKFADSFENAMEHLADYLYHTLLVPEQQEILKLAALMYDHYDALKFRDKLFTYNDIGYYTFSNLYHPELSLVHDGAVTNFFYEQLTSAIRFILIDEFQDTSIIQLKILMPIIKEVISGYGAEEYGGVVVVGDEKQSIYGWRGGERDLLLAMPGILADAEQVELDTSYRSDKQIIEFVNRLFSHKFLHDRLQAQHIEWPYHPVRAHRQSEAGYVEVHLRNSSRTDSNGNDIARDEDVLREMVEQHLLPKLRANELDVSKTAILARRNSDLETIANLLEEYSVAYLLESTHSIVHHRAIKPIMMLLRFLTYHDFYDLLCLMRSDVFLISPEHLKSLIQNYKAMQGSIFEWRTYFKRVAAIPGIPTVQQIMFPASDDISAAPTHYPPSNLLGFVQAMAEQLNIVHIFNQENDIKNLHFFFELVAGFQQMRRNYPASLKGFIDYCHDYETHESFQQVGLETARAISLLTIHKSKGLEFDTVFVYWNLSTRGRAANDQLHYYTRYAADFNAIEAASLTFNYKHVLAASHQQPLTTQAADREIIEELNNLYVAITRAKSNLFLHFSLQSTKGLDEFWKSVQKKEAAIDRVLACCVQQLLETDQGYSSQTLHQASGSFGQFHPAEFTELSPERDDLPDISRYIAFANNAFIKKQDHPVWEHVELTRRVMYLQHRRIDRGNVAHFYLSFIYYGSDAEKTHAADRTIEKYGSLFPIAYLRSLFAQLNSFIDDHPALYDRSRWQQVYTEHTIFSNGQELRLDRMMVDEANRIIQIIDYKTGAITELNQIDEYIDIVKKFFYVQANGYVVSGEYMSVELE